MEAANNKKAAVAQAVASARSRLAQANLESRCHALGIPAPRDGRCGLRMFGADMVLDASRLELCSAAGEPARQDDLLLLLHYLLCDVPVARAGKLTGFREFPGGEFYHGPFLARSSSILLQRFGNNLAALRANCARLDHEVRDIGDLAAEFHAFGQLYATVVYRVGDDEFPPACDFLFDAAVRRALCTEDAAALATRICTALL
jgi:hypothetical protein